ncbi:MAG: hypothetical protein Q4B77_05640 [Coriobacteriaceae bacterium]|nr:hypothetical protein [Coriobacteriaceae bacterium]
MGEWKMPDERRGGMHPAPGKEVAPVGGSWDTALADAPTEGPGASFGPSTRVRAIATAAIAALIALLILGLAPHFSSPEAHAEVIATIDEKIDNVLTLTAGSAGASALISAIPGDAGSPIADKLMDLSTGFLIVLAALFLEKYLITILSGVALGIVLPLALLCVIAFVWAYGRARWSAAPLQVGAKLAAIAAVLLLAIPTSSWVTNQIDAVYDTSLQQSIESAESLAEGAAEAEQEGEKSAGGILGFFQDAVETVTGGISSAVEGAQESLNQFIESLAVMLVTSCLIPILVLFFYFWMAKILLGIQIDMPAAASALNPRRVRRRVSSAVKGGDRA